VVETVGLGIRQQVHLLEVGGRRLLISATRENVRLLADVTDAFEAGGPADGTSAGPGGGKVGGGPSSDAGGFINILNTKLGGDA